MFEKLPSETSWFSGDEDMMLPVDHLASPDHEEAAVPDVGGVQLEVGVGEHHQTRRAGADHLRLALLHLAETLERDDMKSNETL